MEYIWFLGLRPRAWYLYENKSQERKDEGHQVLEGLSLIAQPKKHVEVLKHSKGCGNSNLGDICWSHCVVPGGSL